MQEFINELNIKAEKLRQNENIDLRYRIDFLDEFLVHCDLSNLANMRYIEDVDLFKAVLYAEVSELSTRKLDYIAEDLEELLSHVNNQFPSNFFKYIQNIDSLINDGLLEIYQKYRDYIFDKMALADESGIEFDMREVYKNERFQNIIEIESHVFDCLKREDIAELADNFIGIYLRLNNFCAFKNTSSLFFLKSTIKELLSNPIITDAQIGEKLKNIIKIFDSKEAIFETEHALSMYVKQANAEIRARNKECNKIKEIALYLEREKKGTINYHFIKNKKVDYDIQLLCYEEILKHNEEKYNELISKYETSHDNKIKLFFSIFSQNGFDFALLSDVQQQYLLENCQLNRLDEILKMFNYQGEKLICENNPSFSNVIVESDFNMIQNITSSIDKGLFTKDFVINNFSLLLSKSIYSLVNENIILFGNRGINLDAIFDNASDLLFWDTSVLLKRLDTLKNMGIEFTEQITNFYAIYNDDFLHVLYLFQSIIGDTIKNNFEIIDENYELVLKRIRICMLLGVGIYTDSGKVKKSIVTGNKFYVIDQELEEYDDPSLAQYLALTK